MITRRHVVAVTARWKRAFRLRDRLWPDGSRHVLATGQLRVSMARIDDERTRRRGQELLQVFHPHDAFQEVPTAEPVTYVIEVWPTASLVSGHYEIRRL